MHPYDKVLANPHIMRQVKESFEPGSKQRQLVDIVENSPSPGVMMCALMRMYGMGDSLYEILKPFVPTPDMMIKDLKYDIDETLVSENRANINGRYAILGTSACIRENFSIGYLTGYLQGMIAGNVPVHELSPDTLMCLKMNFLAAEQLVAMGHVTGEIALSVSEMGERLRKVAKGEAP